MLIVVDEASVLIESDWNLKLRIFKLAGGIYGCINRIRLEFKGH